jgi:hypothetical protein
LLVAKEEENALSQRILVEASLRAARVAQCQCQVERQGEWTDVAARCVRDPSTCEYGASRNGRSPDYCMAVEDEEEKREMLRLVENFKN